jgi:hypothetical protein
MIGKYGSQHYKFCVPSSVLYSHTIATGKKRNAQKWQFLYYKIQRFFLLLHIQHNSSAILQRNLKRICAFSRQAAASSVKGLSKEFYFTLAAGMLKLDLKCASSQARHANFIGLQITTSPHI